MVVLLMVGWLVFSYILASFIEHQVHRKLMHRKNFLSARMASFKRIFEAHALVHHRHYAEIFSDEPVGRGEDKEIRLTVRNAQGSCLLRYSWCPGRGRRSSSPS
jgi:hypothetical protein